MNLDGWLEDHKQYRAWVIKTCRRPGRWKKPNWLKDTYAGVECSARTPIAPPAGSQNHMAAAPQAVERDFQSYLVRPRRMAMKGVRRTGVSDQDIPPASPRWLATAATAGLRARRAPRRRS
jgi:hypothetical protein